MLTWTIHLEGGPMRVNHAAVAIGARIFSFGGYCKGEDYETLRPMDTHMLNTFTLRWTLLPLPNEEEAQHSPYQRYGHTAVEYKGAAYIWGGRNDSIGACKTLYRFSGTTLKWDHPEVTGNIPEARDGHTATVINDRMYTFAGYEEFTDRFSNDINYLDLKTFEWVPIRSTHCKPARWRDFHSATAIGSTIYIFGGRSDVAGDLFTNHEVYCNKVISFDTATNTWGRTSPKSSSPVGRRSHSAFEYKGNMYIFGGYNGKMELHFNDLYRLDVGTMQWTKLDVPGTAPSPRRRQCACMVGSKVYFFGGTSPRAPGDKTETAVNADADLIDRSDLFVLDFEPTLKTLASLVIIKHNLDRECLPHDLRWELNAMTTDNTISRLHTTNG